MELITIGSRPSGGIRTFFGVFATPQFVQALFTVYLLHELKVPGSDMYRRSERRGHCSVTVLGIRTRQRLQNRDSLPNEMGQ